MPIPFLTRRSAMLSTALALTARGTAAAASPSWTDRITGRVVGSGRPVNESRLVKDFQAIALTGKMKLVLRQGTREGLELRGDDNVLPLIEARVVEQGGLRTLLIGTRQGARYATDTPVLATIDLITLKALAVTGEGEIACDALKTAAIDLDVSGSADLHIDRLDTAALSASIAGRAEMRFSGRASRVTMSVSGSGEVHARELDADDVTIDVAGQGDVTVQARRTLTVSVAGMGNVAYAGDAVVKSAIAGMGNVRKL